MRRVESDLSDSGIHEKALERPIDLVATEREQDVAALVSRE